MSLSLTRTFLFTDIEGSTKLWETHHDAMQVALARHDNLLREAIEQHNGVVFKTIGDAFCAVFESPVDAAEAAIHAQQSLATEAWPAPITLRVRMAVHTGVAEQRNEDYFGPPLNRVARLLSIGHGGQTLLSLAAYELTRDQLSPELNLADLGMHRLKDLIRPEHVFQLNTPSLSTRFPALRSLNSFANNLPQQLTSFIGREDELHKITTLLASSRLVTLTGSGGCGKTRLALQLGADLLERYPDGVFVVEFASLTNASLVPKSVAGTLGISNQAADPLQALSQTLSDRKLLLILDNCEHLVEACAELVTTLLQMCPMLTILATSREALQVLGEQLFRVPSLSLPERHPPPPADKLSQFTAVQLFIERAQAVRADFTVTNANAPGVAEICWKLDGIPLAIELAAARLRNMGIEDLLRRLEDRFRILILSGRGGGVPRQQTLRALIDWSYDLLNEQEQLLLARLSVFVGGWSLEAAEGICSGAVLPPAAETATPNNGGILFPLSQRGTSARTQRVPGGLGGEVIEDWEVLDLLSSLVDKSLVLLDGNRYKMLETIKQYTQEKARQQGETETLRKRHLTWFKQKVEAQFRKYNYENQPNAYSGLVSEVENLRVALQFAQEREDDETVLVLAGYPKHIWLLGTYCSEMKQYLSEAHSQLAGTPDSLLQGFTLVAASNYSHVMGDLKETKTLAEEGLALHRRLQHATGIADALCGVGLSYELSGQYSESLACFLEMIPISQALGQTHWLYIGYANSGYIHLLLGNLEEAEFSIRLSLEEPHLIPLSHGERLHSLAQLFFQRGQLAQARETHCQGIAVSYKEEDWFVTLSDLGAFARLALRANHAARCVQLLGATHALGRRCFMSLTPHERASADQDLAHAREVLSPEAFERAWATGLAMTVDEAVAYALEEPQ